MAWRRVGVGGGSPFSPARSCTTTLVVIDGSWRQAKAVLRRNPGLWAGARGVLSLAHEAPAVFGALKREPARACLSTAESTAAALGALLWGDAARGRRVVEPAVRRIVELQWALAPAALAAARERKAAAAAALD